jgi:hypothetical protein
MIDHATNVQSHLLARPQIKWLTDVLNCMIQFKPEDMAGIMKDFDEPGTLAPTGLFLGPTKYMVIQGEPGAVIRGKKVAIDRIHPSLKINFFPPLNDQNIHKIALNPFHL